MSQRSMLWCTKIIVQRKGLKLNGELKGVDADAQCGTEHRTLMKQNIARVLRHPEAANLILGIVIGLGVCAPLLGGDRLFLLDWSVGPHNAIATPAALGLNGGLTTGIGGTFVV